MIVLFVVTVTLAVLIAARLLQVRRLRAQWFLDQVAFLLRDRLPLADGVERMSRDAPPRIGRWLAAVADGLRLGLPIEEVLAVRPRILPDYAVRAMAAAEATGTLEPTVERLRRTLERRETRRLRRGVILLYPLFLACLPVAMAEFTQRFTGGMKQSLGAEGWPLCGPNLQFAVLAPTLAAIAAFGLAVVFALGLSGLLDRMAAASRRSLDSLLLFTEAHAIFLRAGVAPAAAIRSAARAIPSRRAAQDWERTAQRIETGRSLAAAIETVPWLPAPYRLILRAGEAANRLPDALDDAAAWLNLRLGREPLARKLVLPALVLGIGALIGLQAHSVMQTLVTITGAIP